ncbi:unnamed protein product [Boreogadus saida]
MAFSGDNRELRSVTNTTTTVRLSPPCNSTMDCERLRVPRKKGNREWPWGGSAGDGGSARHGDRSSGPGHPGEGGDGADQARHYRPRHTSPADGPCRGSGTEENEGADRRGRKHRLRRARSHLLDGPLPTICNSNVEASGPGCVCVSAGMWRSEGRVHRWLHGTGGAAAVEELLLTDSRWGCSPIRARLLEDDDNGGPGRTREDQGQRQACDAHSCLPGSV